MNLNEVRHVDWFRLHIRELCAADQVNWLAESVRGGGQLAMGTGDFANVKQEIAKRCEDIAKSRWEIAMWRGYFAK